jgi:hypothetical protein
MVKKPVINVDNLEDAGDGTAPSPVMDLVASAFAVRNVAHMLVTESASIQGTFIWFHEQIVTSLDRITEVLVKEQTAVQRDQFVSFRLLKWIAEALERLSPQQTGVVPMEGPVVAEMEVVPVVVADVEQARTPLFLRDLDLMDMPFALEASKNSEEDLESSSGSEESGSDDGSFVAMDGDTMVEQVPVVFPFFHVFLFFLLIRFFSSCINHVLFCIGNISLCVRCLLTKRNKSGREENEK